MEHFPHSSIIIQFAGLTLSNFICYCHYVNYLIRFGLHDLFKITLVGTYSYDKAIQINILGMQLTPILINSLTYRVRNFRGRVSYFDQSEEREHHFLTSDWSKYETLPQKYRTLLNQNKGSIVKRTVCSGFEKVGTQ